MTTTTTAETFILKTRSDNDGYMYWDGKQLNFTLDLAKTYKTAGAAMLASKKLDKTLGQSLVATTRSMELFEINRRAERATKKAAEETHLAALEAYYPWMTADFWLVVRIVDELNRAANDEAETSTEIVAKFTDNPGELLHAMHWNGEQLIKTNVAIQLLDELTRGLNWYLDKARGGQWKELGDNARKFLRHMTSEWTGQLCRYATGGNSTSVMSNLEDRMRAAVLADEVSPRSLHSNLNRALRMMGVRNEDA